jgi:GT2 family glycosyltransferase
MANSPSVWIVVLNWNGVSDTLACLESLRELQYTQRRVVVVDNGSTDGSVDALRAAKSRLSIEIIEAASNLGYAGGNNLGIRYALEHDADFILILNNDTVVDPMLLDELVAAATQHPEAGCFGPWIFYMHDRDRLWFTRSWWETEAAAFTARSKGKLASELANESTSTEYVCGAALFFRSEVAQKIGLLDKRFFLVYEDSDWGFRARRAGFECLAVPSAKVWHKIGTSFGSEESPLRTYFSSRNKLLWAEKHLSRREWLQILSGSLGRFSPGFGLEVSEAGSRSKALLWGIDEFVRELSRKRHDPQEIAHRCGVRDYLLRRFGDCAPKIRALAQKWAAGQPTIGTDGTKWS